VTTLTDEIVKTGDTAAFTITRTPDQIARLQAQNNHYENVCERLSADDYTALQDSILAHGILIPVVVDKDGNIIDGHNRTQIAINHNIVLPTLVADVTTDTEIEDRAWVLNRARRHMTSEQKLAYTARKITEGATIADIAADLEESPKTTRSRINRKNTETQQHSETDTPKLPSPSEIKQSKIDTELLSNPNRSNTAIAQVLTDAGTSVTDKTIAGRREALNIEPFKTHADKKPAKPKAPPTPKPAKTELQIEVDRITLAVSRLSERLADLYENKSFAAAKTYAKEKLAPAMATLCTEFKEYVG
jgi:ParB-like chromosome segregation protein Spo0J